MSELEIVRISVDTERKHEFHRAIENARSGYFAPPNCLGADLSDEGQVMVLVIRWASASAHVAAASSPSANAFFSAIQSFAAGPPSIETLTNTVGGRLVGQVAIVTGGARGIGRAIVERFVAEGAKVGVGDVNEQGLEDLKAQFGSSIFTLITDVRSADANVSLIESTISKFGRLDTFVANAGLSDAFAETVQLSLEQIEDGFDDIFGVNVLGLILGSRAALPHLVATRGSIIVTLSNSALYPDGGGVLYVASKHAALGVVKQLAHEFAPLVRVNAVSPGATTSNMTVPEALGRKGMDQSDPDTLTAISELIPLRRVSEPYDHTDAFVLLASRSESASMTSTIIESDGGLGVRGLRRTRGGDDLLNKLALD